MIEQKIVEKNVKNIKIEDLEPATCIVTTENFIFITGTMFDTEKTVLFDIEDGTIYDDIDNYEIKRVIPLVELREIKPLK